MPFAPWAMKSPWMSTFPSAAMMIGYGYASLSRTTHEFDCTMKSWTTKRYASELSLSVMRAGVTGSLQVVTPAARLHWVEMTTSGGLTQSMPPSGAPPSTSASIAGSKFDGV